LFSATHVLFSFEVSTIPKKIPRSGSLRLLMSQEYTWTTKCQHLSQKSFRKEKMGAIFRFLFQQELFVRSWRHLADGRNKRLEYITEGRLVVRVDSFLTNTKTYGHHF